MSAGDEMSTTLPESDAKEFSTVEDVLALLDMVRAAGAKTWLHGGWAFEAITGISRPHHDIDLLSLEEYRPILRDVFRELIGRETSHKLEFSFRGSKVDFVFAEPWTRGRFVSWSPRLIVPWPGNLISHDRRAKLGGREVPVICPEALFIEIANDVGRVKHKMRDKAQRDLALYGDLLVAPENQAAMRKMYPLENTRWNRLRVKLGL